MDGELPQSDLPPLAAKTYQALFLCGDFERLVTEEEWELPRSHEQTRDGRRVSALYDDLVAQGRHDVEVEDGVGDGRPT